VARRWRRFAEQALRFDSGEWVRKARSIRVGTVAKRLLMVLAVVGLAAGVMAPGEQSADAGDPAIGTAVSTTTPPAPIIKAAPAHSLPAVLSHPELPKNSARHDTLSSHAPQNWYRFALPARSDVEVQLSSLPADYNLRLYDGTGRKLLSSDRARKQAETVSRTLSAGTYFVRVASSRGAYGKAEYTLLVKVAQPAKG
jgi:hypothetical protein